jgi:sugar/nucleoside kinase (ribokinase family)
MSYDELTEALAADDETRTVTALPDGSVDIYYSVYDIDGERIRDRETFAERIMEDPPAFPVTRHSTEPGGQAVNAAIQADALDDSVHLFGHLDDPVFGDLDFKTTSMGAPSQIAVYPMDEDILFADRSEELAEWTLADFRIAAESPKKRLEADVVCLGNWVSVPGMTDSIRELAESALDGNLLLFDPGPISISSEEAIRDLFDALSALESVYDVILSVNGSELAAGAAALDCDGDRREQLSALRGETAITAAVVHTTDEATVSIEEGIVCVANRSVENPTRETGAGDRFGAGLAHGLSRDWDWETALALANACGAYYVENAETATRETLREWL